MRGNVSKDAFDASRPRGLKVGDSGQPCHEVDSHGSDSELNDPAGSGKVHDPDAEVRAQKVADGPKDAFCVFRSGVDIEVEIFRRARTSMKGNGVGAGDEESSAVSVQGLDELFVVAGSHGFLSSSARKGGSPPPHRRALSVSDPRTRSGNRPLRSRIRKGPSPSRSCRACRRLVHAPSRCHDSSGWALTSGVNAMSAHVLVVDASIQRWIDRDCFSVVINSEAPTEAAAAAHPSLRRRLPMPRALRAL